MTALGALLGALSQDGDDVELMSGIDVISPLTLTPNNTTLKNELGLDADALVALISEDLEADPSERPEVFGGGADADLTASNGTTTLTGPAYYRTVTLTGTAKINRAGYPLYIQHFDATNAPAGAIFDDGTAGGNGVSNSTAGNDGGAASAATSWLGSGAAGGAGGDPATGAGNNGTAGTTTGADGLGGAGGAGGQGGAAFGAGGTPGAAGAVGTCDWRFLTLVEHIWYRQGGGTASVRVLGGSGGGGGSSGSGNNGGSNGGSGGGGGGGARPGFMRIGKITTGPSTPAGVITAKGGAGGNGAPTGDVGVDVGGGAGGGGGGGGYMHVIVGRVVGQTVAGFFSAAGGAGGAGSAGLGTGTAGAAGAGGAGGKIDLILLHKNASARTTGAAAVGAVGGLCAADLTL